MAIYVEFTYPNGEVHPYCLHNGYRLYGIKVNGSRPIKAYIFSLGPNCPIHKNNMLGIIYKCISKCLHPINREFYISIKVKRMLHGS